MARQVGMIVRWRDLDTVHANEGQPGQLFDDAQHLGHREASRLGCSSTGCERGIQAVDVQTHVHGRMAVLRESVANLLQDAFELRGRLQPAQIPRREDDSALVGNRVAGLAAACRADADLGETRLDGR